MRPVRTAAVLILLAATPAGAAGQAPLITSPAAAAAGSGNGSNWYPFGTPSQQYQQVHSADSFSASGPLTVTSLSFRPRYGATAAAVEAELYMASSPRDAFAASSVFADNVVGGTEVRVVDRRRFDLPATTSFDWNLRLPFDRSFTWTGGHLSWRLVNHDNRNGGAPTYYACDAFTNFGLTDRTGSFTGCASPSGSQPAEQFLRLRSPGTLTTVYGHSYVASGGLPAILMIGLRPLAIDLTAFGASGCVLTTELAASLTGVTQSGPDGSVAFSLPLPRVRRMTGATFYSQVAFVQASANRLGLFFTPGSTNVIGRNHGVSRIVGSVGAAVGGAEPQFGLGIGLR